MLVRFQADRQPGGRGVGLAAEHLALDVPLGHPDLPGLADQLHLPAAEVDQLPLLPPPFLLRPALLSAGLLPSPARPVPSLFFVCVINPPNI